MRKKNQHVSTLHVIHHGCMPMSVWFGVKFTPGGHSTFFGLLNTFVHIIMYFYYMVAAMGPEYQKYIWWKKHLTSLQMIQFIGIMTHAFQLLFVECNYPRAFVWWIGMHAVMFFFLFSEFYKQTYNHKRHKGEKGLSAFAKFIPCNLQVSLQLFSFAVLFSAVRGLVSQNVLLLLHFQAVFVFIKDSVCSFQHC
jgi:elongation of very long chain fatty acids protein 7